MDLLRLATAGSVDDGKSTLIGRLLLDAKLILEDQLETLNNHNGDGPDLASMTDGLRAEREQGITIDVAYRFFQTDKRSFIIADTPGHERYTRNMVSGASTAELGLILIDARNGIVDQSRRHTCLSALLGIQHLVACVNKMDLVDWDEERFREIETEFRELAERLEVPDATVIPIAALHGDNVVDRCRRRALVRRAAAARAPGDRRGPPRPDARRAAAAGAVDDPPARRPRRRARVRGPARRRRARGGRRGRRDALGLAHHGQGGPHLRRAARPRGVAALRLRAAGGRPRRRARRPDLRTRRRAGRGPRARRHGRVDGRRRAAPRRPLRAQAHDAHGARDGPGRARPARHDDAGGQAGAGPARAQRHRPHHAAHERARARRPLRRQPHHGRVHPHRRAHQRHRRRGHDRGGARAPPGGGRGGAT